jgi:hypothetical protein
VRSLADLPPVDVPGQPVLDRIIASVAAAAAAARPHGLPTFSNRASPHS